MRGSKAKAIRKAVYGDMSQRQRDYDTEYYRDWLGMRKMGNRRNKPESLRAKYQAAKKL